MSAGCDGFGYFKDGGCFDGAAFHDDFLFGRGGCCGFDAGDDSGLRVEVDNFYGGGVGEHCYYHVLVVNQLSFPEDDFMD